MSTVYVDRKGSIAGILRPRLGWMDGLIVSLGSRGMTLGAARVVVRSEEPCFTCRC